MVCSSSGCCSGHRAPGGFTSGIAGRTTEGERIPKRTLRIVGTLTLDANGLRWNPLLPWRRPRLVEVSWKAVSQIDTGYVSAEGWDILLVAPSARRRFLATLEALGFTLHHSPAWSDRWFAMPPGFRPDWNRVGHEYGVPVGVATTDERGK